MSAIPTNVTEAARRSSAELPAARGAAPNSGGKHFAATLSVQTDLLNSRLRGDEKVCADQMFEAPRSDAQGRPPSDASRAAEQNRFDAGKKPRKSEPAKQSHVRTDLTSHDLANPAVLQSRQLDIVRNTNASASAAELQGDEGTFKAAAQQDHVPQSAGGMHNPTIAGQASLGRTISGAPSSQKIDLHVSNSPGQIDPVEVKESEAGTNMARQMGRILAGVTGASPQVSADATEAPRTQPAPQKQNPAAAPPPKESAQSPTNRTADAGKSERPTSDFEQLVQSIRLRIGSRNSTAVMRLHPPELGRMRIDVRMSGANVKVSVQTETEAAREVVAQRAGELRAALAQHGLTISQLEVSIRTPAAESGAYFAQPWATDVRSNSQAAPTTEDAHLDGKAPAAIRKRNSLNPKPARSARLDVKV